MNNLIAGLQLLQAQYIKIVNHDSAVSVEGDEIIVGPTDRQMTYNDVRVMADWGWYQVKDVPRTQVVNAYDVTLPWRYLP